MLYVKKITIIILLSTYLISYESTILYYTITGVQKNAWKLLPFFLINIYIDDRTVDTSSSKNKQSK